jgi:hypothetical protein
MRRVDAGSTTVWTSRSKWRTAGSGAVIDADGTGFVDERRNWKTLCSKLKTKTEEQGAERAVTGSSGWFRGWQL